jgi:hypothetical protein
LPGCPLSPTLFKIHFDEIITKWQTEDVKGIPLPKNQLLLMLLFADDQVTISNTEYNLQKVEYKLNNKRIWFIYTENKIYGT